MPDLDPGFSLSDAISQRLLDARKGLIWFAGKVRPA